MKKLKSICYHYLFTTTTITAKITSNILHCLIHNDKISGHMRGKIELKYLYSWWYTSSLYDIPLKAVSIVKREPTERVWSLIFRCISFCQFKRSFRIHYLYLRWIAITLRRKHFYCLLHTLVLWIPV